MILEIGEEAQGRGGRLDWPGLDRWGTSEDDAVEKLLSTIPRYAGVAERAGVTEVFARARDVEVVERGPGFELDRLLEGIAHVPSQIEAVVSRLMT